MTSVTAEVDPSRQEEFLDGYRQLITAAKPDGLMRSELLKGPDGRWRIESLWRNRAALMAMRESGRPPAALELFDRVGAPHSHDVFSVEEYWSE